MSKKMIEYKVFNSEEFLREPSGETSTPYCFSIKRKILWGLLWVEMDEDYSEITDMTDLVTKLWDLKLEERCTIDISDIKDDLNRDLDLSHVSDYL